MRLSLLWALTALLAGYVGSSCSQHSSEHTIASEYVSTPYDEKPELKNRDEATRIVEKHYPANLRSAGKGARILVRVFVDVDGRVKNTEISSSSGNEAFDKAAMAAAREFEFIPARLEGRIVPVWIALPITFSVSRR